MDNTLTQTCNTCRHFGVMLGAQKNLITICRYNPPAVFAQAIPIQGQIGWLTCTAWPSADAGDSCGRHDPKPVVAS